MRPLPVTAKMLTVLGKHQDADKFFAYSPECKYLYGNYEMVSDKLLELVSLGRDDEDCSTVLGPLALYDCLRRCASNFSDESDKSSSKKTSVKAVSNKG
jgi:hypothetical protein